VNPSIPIAPTTPPLDRKALRQRLLALRLGLEAPARAQADRIISERLRAFLDDIDGTVSFYWPMQGEFDARGVMADWLRAGAAQGRPRIAALPVVVEKRAPLGFRPWVPGAAMATGIFNTTIPAQDTRVTPTTLLVPLVGFDAANYRLGYGGGYYDRTLAQLPGALAVGIGYQVTRFAHLQPQAHDIPMRQVICDA
jgi:5-formyltetrahydrofolate cyclo-ligase